MHKWIYIILGNLLCWGINGQIHLNEILSSNQTGITDSDGDHEDWIEIYNSSSIDISLGGWYLSDRDNNPRMWKFPDTLTLKSKDFLLVWASGKDRRDHAELHTNFSISREGEAILLSNSDGNLIDRLPPVALNPDRSYGRSPDGTGNPVTFFIPTPGGSNKINGQAPVAVNLSFNTPEGYQPNPFTLLINADANTDIFYTTDGSLPTPSSIHYTDGIYINDRKGTPNTIANIRSGVGHFWEPPRGEVPKVFAIRAQPFRNGMACGEEITGTYWTGHHNPEIHNIPIVSLITDPNHLFNYREGMYIPGIDWDSLNIENAYRRGRETEKLAVFTYFDEEGSSQINQVAGIRINGGITRRAGQKSLRLYARNEYGSNTFDYPFFPERKNHHYRRLLLNTLMGDWTFTLFKDELAATIVKDLGFEYQAFKPVLVFINGEYWALHFLKERRDEHYLSALSGIPEDQIDHLANYNEVQHGSLSHFQEMMKVLNDKGLDGNTRLDSLKTYMDMKNFIDYNIAQIFLANNDWPQLNNEYWRPDTSGGRWRWIFQDLDASMRTYNRDNFTHYTKPHDPLSELEEWSTHILRTLLQIPEFNRVFRARFYELIQTIFSTENMLKEIKKMKRKIEPHVSDYVYRWQIPRSVYEWEENLTILENFAHKRPAEMLAILKSALGSPFNIFPNPGHDELHIRHTGQTSIPPVIQVFDVLGREIDFRNMQTGDFPELKYNTSGLKPGVYLIRIEHGGLLFSHKWIKRE
jgi:hypothetical protein